MLKNKEKMRLNDALDYSGAIMCQVLEAYFKFIAFFDARKIRLQEVGSKK